MLVGSFVEHLIYPMTYTAPNGELKSLTSGDIARVTAIVLSALTLTIIESLYSSRSLKTNFVTIGMFDVAVFYLATAAMKRKSRDSSLSQKSNHSIDHGPKPSEPGQKPDSSKTEEQVQTVTQTSEHSDGLEQDIAPNLVLTSSATLADNNHASVQQREDAQESPPGSDAKETEKPPGAPSSTAEEIPGENGQQLIQGAVQDQKTHQQELPPGSDEKPLGASSSAVVETHSVNGQQKIQVVAQDQNASQQEPPPGPVAGEAEKKPGASSSAVVEIPRENGQQKIQVAVQDQNASQQELQTRPVVRKTKKKPGASSSAVVEIPRENGEQKIPVDRKASPQKPSSGPVVRKAENLQSASSPAVVETHSITGQQKTPVAIQNQKKTYQQLIVTTDEAQVISEMIGIIKDTTIFTAISNQPAVIQLGKKVEHIHPLKFLETVLTNDDLKKVMREIEGSTILSLGFLYGGVGSSGFIAKCERADKLGDIEPYLPDFCRVVGVDDKKVNPLYHAKEWGKLIRFLVKN